MSFLFSQKLLFLAKNKEAELLVSAQAGRKEKRRVPFQLVSDLTLRQKPIENNWLGSSFSPSKFDSKIT